MTNDKILCQIGFDNLFRLELRPSKNIEKNTEKNTEKFTEKNTENFSCIFFCKFFCIFFYIFRWTEHLSKIFETW